MPSALRGLPDLRMHLEVTDRCNLACAHCFKCAESHDLPVELVERVLAQAAELGVRSATFGGGEPTLHPGLPRMLERAVALGMRVGLVSNAKGFARTAEWLRELPRGDEGLAAVSFSLDGPDADTHDAVRAPGAFAGVREALALCRDLGIATTTKTVVQRQNLGRLEAIVRLASSMGCEAAEFAGMVPTLAAVRSGLQPSPAELRRARAELDDLAGVYRTRVLRDISLGHDIALVCCDPYRARSFSVDARGRLSLCCMLSTLGDAPACDSDIVADLAETRLAEAISGFTAKGRDLLLRRAECVRPGGPGALSEFVCTWCAAAMRKLDWLSECPGSEWASLATEREVSAVETAVAPHGAPP
jgi:MoaA/NifB/PqqE/SkfB family radical SAM enzyme